jgi:hypothetical protein
VLILDGAVPGALVTVAPKVHRLEAMVPTVDTAGRVAGWTVRPVTIATAFLVLPDYEGYRCWAEWEVAALDPPIIDAYRSVVALLGWFASSPDVDAIVELAAGATVTLRQRPLDPIRSRV